jgi:hypothetical protein
VRLLAPQRALVDEFIEQSIRTTRDNRVAARTLFELLLPNEIKDQAPEQDDTIFIVDEEAARYPWELLDDRFSRGEGDKPLFVTHGMLRQLESVEFRERVRGVIHNTALVIGDPLSPTRAQGRPKAEPFTAPSKRRALSSRARERPSSRQVINALYADDYKVLHLAGHGVYRLPSGEGPTARPAINPCPRRWLKSAPNRRAVDRDDHRRRMVLSPRRSTRWLVPELFSSTAATSTHQPGDQRP